MLYDVVVVLQRVVRYCKCDRVLCGVVSATACCVMLCKSDSVLCDVVLEQQRIVLC